MSLGFCAAATCELSVGALDASVDAWVLSSLRLRSCWVGGWDCLEDVAGVGFAIYIWVEFRIS